MHFCCVGGIKCIYEIKQKTFHKLKIAQHNRACRLYFFFHLLDFSFVYSIFFSLLFFFRPTMRNIFVMLIYFSFLYWNLCIHWSITFSGKKNILKNRIYSFHRCCIASAIKLNVLIGFCFFSKNHDNENEKWTVTIGAEIRFDNTITGHWWHTIRFSS